MDINLESLQNAVRQLERAVEAYSNNPDTEFVRDALITRFTFTFAQAITILGRYLYTVHCMSDGHIISPRQRIRHAARIGLINNCESWLRHAENRNRVEHAYSEPMADAITNRPCLRRRRPSSPHRNGTGYRRWRMTRLPAST